MAQAEWSSCCLFSLSPKIQPENILRAQLWVHLRAADVVTAVSLQISRLQVGKGGNSTRVSVPPRKVGAGSWQSVDIESLLQAWLRQPEANYGIEINAYADDGEDLAVTSARPGEAGLVSARNSRQWEPAGPRGGGGVAGGPIRCCLVCAFLWVPSRFPSRNPSSR